MAGTVLNTGTWGGRTCHLVSLEDQSWDNANLDINLTLGDGYHLATITSQAENDFVVSLLTEPGSFWLGGFQPPDETDPEANWSWVTGEIWDYTNWSDPTTSGLPFTQPDDAYGPASEQYLQLWHHDYRWNDEAIADYSGGYIAETIPEPATMMLLGLGGLLLRKRRA